MTAPVATRLPRSVQQPTIYGPPLGCRRRHSSAVKYGQCQVSEHAELESGARVSVSLLHQAPVASRYVPRLRRGERAVRYNYHQRHSAILGGGGGDHNKRNQIKTKM